MNMLYIFLHTCNTSIKEKQKREENSYFAHHASLKNHDEPLKFLSNLTPFYSNLKLVDAATAAEPFSL